MREACYRSNVNKMCIVSFQDLSSRQNSVGHWSAFNSLFITVIYQNNRGQNGDIPIKSSSMGCIKLIFQG